MRKPTRDSNNSRKLADARTKRQLEAYHGKLALMDAWQNVPEEYPYWLKLKRQADRLRQQLIVKGVF
jgi:hypothetical protein